MFVLIHDGGGSRPALKTKSGDETSAISEADAGLASLISSCSTFAGSTTAIGTCTRDSSTAAGTAGKSTFGTASTVAARGQAGPVGAAVGHATTTKSSTG